ncbi:hypothetical protein MUK42_13473, partial [Musa troglodytarum]
MVVQASNQIKTAAHAQGGVRKCPCDGESRWAMEPADKITGISVGAASCVNSIKITFDIDGTSRAPAVNYSRHASPTSTHLFFCLPLPRTTNTCYQIYKSLKTSNQIKTAAHARGGVRKCPCDTESRWAMEPADKITGISVGAASCVNSIKITFDIDGTSRFTLMQDEYLTSVSGYVKYDRSKFPCVSQLTFTTNLGKTYGPYGGGGGDFFEVNVEYDEIKGFFGHTTTEYLTAFGVYASNQIKTAAHARGGVRKCPCDTESRWAMEPADKITGISVGAASCVNSIKITFDIDGTSRMNTSPPFLGMSNTTVLKFHVYLNSRLPPVLETHTVHMEVGWNLFEVNVEYDEIKGFFGHATTEYLTAFGVY